MINWLPCCSRQGRMKGRKSRFSSRCTFVGVGTRERGLDQPIAEVQLPVQKGRSFTASTWLLRNHGAMLACRLGCSKGYHSRDHCKATAYEDSSPRQAQTSLLLPRLRLVFTSPPTKSSQATAGAWPSESYISKGELVPRPKPFRYSSPTPRVYILNGPSPQLLLHLFSSISPQHLSYLSTILTKLTSFLYQINFTSKNNFLFGLFCVVCHKQVA